MHITAAKLISGVYIEILSCTEKVIVRKLMTSRKTDPPSEAFKTLHGQINDLAIGWRLVFENKLITNFDQEIKFSKLFVKRNEIIFNNQEYISPINVFSIQRLPITEAIKIF